MKKSLRQNALAYRKELNASEITAMEREIAASLLTLLQTFKPCTVGLFYPVQGEPDLLQIMHSPALALFSWALPVCCESSAGPVLRFAEFNAKSILEAGQYNIPVPTLKEWIKPQVLLIPCVAFHKNGARIGYGAGWYDRTISQFDRHLTKVGIAYAKTEVDRDFAEPHDQLLDYVVTDEAVIHCLRD